MAYSQKMIERQDEQLDEIHDIAERLHNHAIVINEELRNQVDLIDKLDSQVDQASQKLNFVQKRLSKLLKNSDSKTLSTILILLLVLVILMLLFFYT